MMSIFKKVQCPQCKTAHTVEVYEIAGMNFNEFACEGCELDVAPTMQPSSPRPYQWASVAKVPPCYRPALTSKARMIGLMGKAGSGKSCAMGVLAKHGLWITSTDLKDVLVHAAKGDDDAIRRRGRLKNCPLLAIDDMSQTTYTPGFAAAFFDLLECRVNIHDTAVTIWTCQVAMDQLYSRIAYADAKAPNEPQAIAIIRRLKMGEIYDTLPI